MKNKRVLVIDHGLCPEMAVRFMRDCAEVKYYSTWEQAFVDDLRGKIGVGMEGIERVSSPGPHIDAADFIVFPDTMSSGWAEFLKKHEYPVAAAGTSEKLELDRWYGRNVQRKNNLPTQETYKITGVTELRKFCAGHKNFYIKVDNEFRGISESWEHTDEKSSESRIDYIAYKAGPPFKEEIIFVCEEKLPGLEPGLDAITFDGNLLYPTMGGYEKKGCGYVGRTYDEKELPPAFKLIHDGLSAEFKKNKTRFPYSVEMMIDKDRVPYLLDQTIRLALPGVASLQYEMIDNYTEVFYGLATGQKIAPRMKAKYGAALSMESSEATKVPVNISFPKNMRQWIKFRMACKKGGEFYSIPPFDSVLCVVALGNSVKEVVDLVIEREKEIKGTGLGGNTGDFIKIPDDINTGKSYGINF